MLLRSFGIQVFFVCLNVSGVFICQCLYRVLPSPGQFISSLFTRKHLSHPSNLTQICGSLLKYMWCWLIALIYQNKSKSLKEGERVGEQGEREKKREDEGEKERGSCSKYKSLNAQNNDIYLAEMFFGKTEIQCHGNEHNIAELGSSTIASSTCQGGKLDCGARKSVGVESRI